MYLTIVFPLRRQIASKIFVLRNEWIGLAGHSHKNVFDLIDRFLVFASFAKILNI